MSVPVVKGYQAALNHVFSLTGMDLAASTVVSRMFRSFQRSCSLSPAVSQPRSFSVLLHVAWILQEIGRWSILLLILWMSSGFMTFVISLLPPQRVGRLEALGLVLTTAISLRLPIIFWSEMLSPILLLIWMIVSLAISGMHSKKVSKLLPYPGVHSRKYCCFKGEEVVHSHLLPRTITKLGGALL